MNETRVTIAMAVKGLLITIALLLPHQIKADLGAEGLLGIGGFLELLVLALIPADIWRRLGKRLGGGTAK